MKTHKTISINKQLIKCLIAILLSSNVFSQTKPKDTIITWQENVKLDWSNFQGKPLKDDVITKAETCSEILISANFLKGEIPNFNVSNSFIKSISWTKTDSKRILAHEQLHFDISELYARKIRKKFFELRTLKELNPDIYINEYHRLRKEEGKHQEKYDLETNFSHGEKLDIWIDLIKKELDNLDEFRTPRKTGHNTI